MSIISKIIFQLLILFFFSFKFVLAENLKEIGKFKDWKAIKVSDENSKVCFAQSKPVLQSPKKDDREARLFVTFRPDEKIMNINNLNKIFLIKDMDLGIFFEFH